MTSSFQPSTAYSQLKRIKLKDLNEPGEVLSSELWQHQPAFIYLVRRPGCQFCREFALRLEQERSLLVDRLGVEMYAVVHEEKGSAAYKSYFGGPILMDTDKAFFKALGGGKLRWGSLWKFFSKKFLQNYRRNKQVGVKSDFDGGEGRLLGGILIVSKKGVVWEFKEMVFGDQPSLEDVAKACAKASGLALTAYDLRRVQYLDDQANAYYY